jgi:pimeloyl-ACP methyl ester carboxylesterase
MARFASFDGLSLAYEVTGEGSPVVLLHGFAASSRANWEAPGVVRALVEAGWQAIALDARGHGNSEKPHDPSAYGGNTMVRDVQALFDVLGLERCDVVGYSMGTFTASRLAIVEPRVRSLVLGGTGEAVARPRDPEAAGAIADALVAEDPSAVADPRARAFRMFADSTGADREALAAIQRSSRFSDQADLGQITVPTIIITGDQDILVGSPEGLAALIPGATAKRVAGDHLSAVFDPAFSAEIIAFLKEVESQETFSI